MTRAAITARRQKALEYALSGKTVREIGKLLDVSHDTAHKDVLAAVKSYARTNEKEIDAHRELIRERYVRLWNQWEAAAVDPESKAGDKLLRILEGMRGLYGLDKPVKKVSDEAGNWPTTIVVNRNYVSVKEEECLSEGGRNAILGLRASFPTDAGIAMSNWNGFCR